VIYKREEEMPQQAVAIRCLMELYTVIVPMLVRDSSTNTRESSKYQAISE
jgi:hypothetical protein